MSYIFTETWKLIMFKAFKKSSPFKRNVTKKQIELIKRSNLFDSSWYMSENPDVEIAGMDPIEHYLKNGANEGRNPSKAFDSKWYIDNYQDVKESGINPLLHFIEYGRTEGRLPLPSLLHSSKKIASRYKTAPTQVADLSKKLWGGFSQYASAELAKIADNSAVKIKERVAAIYVLARWHATNSNWTCTVENIRKIRKLDIKSYRSKRTKLLLVEALQKLGKYEEASNFIKPSLEYKFDSDFVCALSNQELPAEQRLSYINEIYNYYSLAPLSFNDASKGMSFGNLKAEKSFIPISNGPKVSILVPVYNAEDYIKVAINSLLEQSWSNIEIIAVDDCSKDRSLKILNELAENDTRLKVFENAENLGAYGTRNKALSLATGDFITVHDSDDWSHPQMLEVQLGAMFSNPRLKVTCSMMARVLPDMRFMLRPQRNNLEYVHRSYPSVLVRASDLKALGEWDGVSANADDEFVQRARILWGKESVQDILTGVPLSFFLVHENSLTQNAKTSLNSLTFGIRHEYSRQANYWKEYKVEDDSETIITERTSLKKPFPIPAGLAPNNWPINNHYDLVIISDLSLLGGTRRCNEGYIAAALESGLRVGLFHWPRYDLKLADIANEYTELTYKDNVDMLVHEDEISADLVIIHHPPILKYEIDAVPKIQCEKLGILINQSPMQLWSQEPHYYNEDEVNQLCVKLFNKKPTWIPISPIVNKTMKMAGGGQHLHDQVWYPPYSKSLVGKTPELPENFGGERKIILGRHSRDHWTKWPSQPKQLQAAYCANSKQVAVKLLGGAKTPKKMLKTLPKNWSVLEFDSVAVDTFISELDFFLHFTHEDYIEEFGRNIMEAMAHGRVVLLPHSYEVIFGDAAVYCLEKDVEKMVLEMWNSAEKYRAQALKGYNFVVDNCSQEKVAKNIAGLLSC